MEETHDHDEYMMWMKRKKILKSHIQAPIFAANKSNWEERAFAEDAARILGGCIWPPRSYSCHFCKREFRSAQALGGHMNVHRRDRARLKQSHDQPLHKDDNFTTSGHLSSRPSSSTISTQENGCMGCHDSEPKVKVNDAEEEFLKDSGCLDYVETSLSMGVKNPLFSQQLGTDNSCGDHLEGIIYKRPKTCSSDRGLVIFNSAEFVLGVKPGMEDLDLELRLGKLPQKV